MTLFAGVIFVPYLTKCHKNAIEAGMLMQREEVKYAKIILPCCWAVY